MRPKYPKFHLVHDCEGLDATPEEARTVTVFASALDLATADWGRACRMCSLESVLISCADPRPARERSVFATFTSQASPRNPDASVLSFDWHAASESGIARLTRLARRLDLGVVSTVSGPVAFGMLTADGAAAVAANLRSVVRPELSSPPSADVVQTLWTFLGDSPPELAEVLGDTSGIDPWEAALALCA